MKRIIIAIISVVMFLSVLLVGCSSSSTVTIDGTTYDKGTYLVYETDFKQLYLEFLNKFDHKKFEIVDISVSAASSDTEEHDDYYIVTYKVK